MSNIGPVTKMRLMSDALITALLVAGGVQALSFNPVAMYMPLFACSVGTLLGLSLLLRDSVKARGHGSSIVADEASSTSTLREEEAGSGLLLAARQLAWFVFQLVCIFLAGIIAGSGLFIASFLRIEARTKLLFTAAAAGAMMALLYLVGQVLNLTWPDTLWSML